MKEGDGIKQKNIYIHTQTQHCGVREKGVGEVGKNAGNKGERDFAQDDGCIMQCIDDVLLSCALEIYMVLRIYVGPINSICNIFSLKK